jgi:hypothetical protein
VYLITSQRDLSATFGVPFFYKTTAGTPINGYELNEYGLLAAYSALGITNQCFVQRVDVDLAALTASLTRPTGTPPAGTYWLNTSTSTWGIFEWNLTTGAFTNKIPLVITNSSELETSSTVPLQSVGSISDYAVTATNIYNPEYYKRGGPTATQTSSVYLSDLYNTWVLIGSNEWCTAWPSISGTLAPTALNGNIVINNTETITVAANATPTAVSNSINSADIAGVYSAVEGGALYIYADNDSVGPTFSSATGNANATTGIATLSAPVNISLGYNTSYGVVASQYSLDGKLSNISSAIQAGDTAKLSTDEKGNFVGIFNVPSTTFQTGSRVFRIDNRSVVTDPNSATTYSEATFTASGLQTTSQQLNFSPSVDSAAGSFTQVSQISNQLIGTISQISPYDPLAQTFIIEKDNYPNGIFLKSVKLFNLKIFPKNRFSRNLKIIYSLGLLKYEKTIF